MYDAHIQEDSKYEVSFLKFQFFFRSIQNDRKTTSIFSAKGIRTKKVNRRDTSMMEISVARRQFGLCRGIGASLLVHSDMFSLMCSGALDDDGTYVYTIFFPFSHTCNTKYVFSPVNQSTDTI